MSNYLNTNSILALVLTLGLALTCAAAVAAIAVSATVQFTAVQLTTVQRGIKNWVLSGSTPSYFTVLIILFLFIITDFLVASPLHCDAPNTWVIYFQNSAHLQMESTTELQDNVLFYMVLALFGGGYLMNHIGHLILHCAYELCPICLMKGVESIVVDGVCTECGHRCWRINAFHVIRKSILALVGVSILVISLILLDQDLSIYMNSFTDKLSRCATNTDHSTNINMSMYTDSLTYCVVVYVNVKPRCVKSYHRFTNFNKNNNNNNHNKKTNKSNCDDEPYQPRGADNMINNSTNRPVLYNVKSPLDQFEVRNLIGLNAPILGYLHIFLANIGFYLTSAAIISTAFSLLAINNSKIMLNDWSLSLESIYATMRNIVINQINSDNGQKYFPFIYILFMFILVNNLIGMVPYSFASTSHFILTFFISFTVVLGATILGFTKHNLKFFSLFVPAGCPLGLLPLLVLIEFISYLARNVSLGLRLAANILSGHMLLNILSGFAYNIMTSGFIYFFVGLIPLAFIIAFSGLELGIAFIQAQVFVVLSSSYIKDALDLH